MKCEYCGKKFNNEKSIKAHHPRCIIFKKNMEENSLKIFYGELYNLYVIQEFSIKELVNKFNVTYNLIYKKLKEFNIELRTNKYTKRRNKKMREAKQNYSDLENEIINNKRKETCLNIYGVDNVFKNKNIIKKIKIIKFNDIDENGKNNFERQTLKRKETCLEKYGYDNVSKIPEISRKIQLKKFENGLRNYDVSILSQKLFWKIYDKLPLNLQEKTYFAELNKEYGLYFLGKYYYYDFVISSIKFCIEFNGDYWHCNPEKYKEDYVHPVTKKIAREIWEADLMKCNLIRQNRNYDCITIWESNYVQNETKIIDDTLKYLLTKI